MEFPKNNFYIVFDFMFKANIDEIGPEFPGQLFNIEIYNFLQELTWDFRKGVGVGVGGLYRKWEI